jgi:hypothetical protein
MTAVTRVFKTVGVMKVASPFCLVTTLVRRNQATLAGDKRSASHTGVTEYGNRRIVKLPHPVCFIESYQIRHRSWATKTITSGEMRLSGEQPLEALGGKWCPSLGVPPQSSDIGR